MRRSRDDRASRDERARAAALTGAAGERALHDALSRATAPGEQAAGERAWRVVGVAFAAREPRRGPSRLRVLAVAAAVALAALVVAVALSPPGDAVAQWVRDVVAPRAEHRQPAPARVGALPAPGRLLVTGPHGAWVVARDGSRRRLGAFSGATWSPHGLFAAAWRGRTLTAVDPSAREHWRLVAPGPVHDVRWSPDGFLVAYRAGGALWLVAGDGTGAHVVDAGPAAVAPAWRPGAPHTLAWVSRSGALVVLDAARGRRVWRSPSHAPGARALTWSADGRRLVAVAPRALWQGDLRANRLRRVPVAPGRLAVAAAWAPHGRQLALVEADRAAGTSAIRVLRDVRRGLPGRTAFTATGRFTSIAWSPDARWLIASWPAADQWLLLRPTTASPATAIAGIRRHFGGPGLVRGWCCQAGSP